MLTIPPAPLNLSKLLVRQKQEVFSLWRVKEENGSYEEEKKAVMFFLLNLRILNTSAYLFFLGEQTSLLLKIHCVFSPLQLSLAGK